MWLLFAFLMVVLAIAGVAAIVSLLEVAWPLLLVALGIWMLRGGRGRPHHYRPGRHQPPPHRHMPGQDATASAVRHSERSAEPSPSPPAQKPGLPIDVQVKVEQIRHKVDVLLGYTDRFPPFSHDLYIVRQTASEYLPHTIDAYLALPPDYAEGSEAPQASTALQELKAQLDLLDAKLDEIARDLQRQDLDRLAANRRFLEERLERASA